MLPSSLPLGLTACSPVFRARSRRAGCLRTVWVYHITWFVNSAAHAWGYQDYETGALLLALVAFSWLGGILGGCLCWVA